MNFLKHLIPIFLMGIIFPCYADLTIVQTLEDLQNNTPSGKEQITLYISGGKVRIDKGQSISSIVLLDKKVTFSIMHETGKYVVLPHDEVKVNQVQNNSAHSENDLLNTSVIEPTGKTEQISGFLCRQIFVREKDGERTELWVSQKALDMKTFLTEFNHFTEFGLLSQISKMLDKHPELNGVPIRMIEYNHSNMIRRATINRIETNSIPVSTFEVPAGYGEIKTSDFITPPPSLLEENLKSLKQ